MTKQNEMKRCTKCSAEKLLTEFNRDRSTKDGKASVCRKCWAEYERQRSGTLRRKASLALKDARRARNKAEKETGRTIKDTLTLYDTVFVLSESECAYCGRDIDWKRRQIDHVTPLRYTGTNTFENIVMACASCNSAKRDMPVMLHIIRSVDDHEAKILIDRISKRSNQDLDEVFAELGDHARAYFEVRAAEQIAKAGAS